MSQLFFFERNVGGTLFFDDNDNEIANNVRRKVRTLDENNSYTNNRKKNDTRF